MPMSSFLLGMIVGGVIGAVLTLLLLVIVAGSQNLEPGKVNPPAAPQWRVFIAALGLLGICSTCFVLSLEKSALVAFMLSVLLIAKLGGSKQGIAAALVAAVIVAWFLPPSGTLAISGFDNRLAFVLFVLGTIVACIVVDGKRWVKRWIAMANPD
jgi:K+-sensing histidine kinase KdpD